MTAAKLLFLCGKMAAGKSTLARELAAREGAILLVQDELLEQLYPGEIVDIADFARCSARLRDAIAPHELHYVVASDELCRRQLAGRSRHLPPGTPWTTAAEFDAITAWFEPPSDDEAFRVVRHERD